MSPQQAGKKKSREKTEIFYSSVSSSKRKRDFGMVPTGEMILTYRATNALRMSHIWKSRCKSFQITTHNEPWDNSKLEK